MTRSRKSKSVEVQFDADLYTYNAAFAVEHTEYALVVGGDALHGVYESKDALNSALETIPAETPRVVYARTFLEEDAEARAKHNVKSQLDNAIAQIVDKFPKHSPVIRPVLTGSGNFRDRVGTIRVYKGNRSSRPKPQLYQALRRYLIEVWGAEVIHGHEADDEVAIRQTTAHAEKRPSIIVHVDKDLLQVPGMHYDPTKGFAEITPAWGLRFFYRQVIQGDTADNVGGVYKSGEKRAKEIITSEMDEPQMVAVCLEEFRRSIEQHGTEKCGYDDHVAAFCENAILLWMCRKYGETWAHREFVRGLAIDVPAVPGLAHAVAVPPVAA